MKSSIGSNIEKRREQLGITRTELAQLIGVSSNTVRNWELGGRRPRSSLLPTLAKTLHVDERLLRTGRSSTAAFEDNVVSVLLEELTERFATIAGVSPDRVVISLQLTRTGAPEDR